MKVKAGVVYSIPCLDCNEEYIGETSRYLGTRIAEHRKDINNDKKAISRSNAYVKENGHKMNFD
jgi:hypothetical protein